VRKSLEPTPTGIELIGLIHEELLKSAELTGIWEKKLREIEQHKYDARQFLDELKQMVTEIVTTVMIVGNPCPKCGKGRIIKGKTAYGCSEWRNGCNYRLPFSNN
jgi:DNA topoisomerase-3